MTKTKTNIQQFKLWQLGALGMIVLPFIIIILGFIVALSPLVTIYFICAKIIDLRSDKHDKNLKYQFKLKTNANLCKLEMALKKLENVHRAD